MVRNIPEIVRQLYSCPSVPLLYFQGGIPHDLPLSFEVNGTVRRCRQTVRPDEQPGKINCELLQLFGALKFTAHQGRIAQRPGPKHAQLPLQPFELYDKVAVRQVVTLRQTLVSVTASFFSPQQIVDFHSTCSLNLCFTSAAEAGMLSSLSERRAYIRRGRTGWRKKAAKHIF